MEFYEEKNNNCIHMDMKKKKLTFMPLADMSTKNVIFFRTALQSQYQSPIF